MTINLHTDQEEGIAKAIESGAHENVHHVIERALEVLRSEDEWLHYIRDEINRKIDRAFSHFEQGSFCTAEELRVQMERCKAALLGARNR
jgi:hypothetical protein